MCRMVLQDNILVCYSGNYFVPINVSGIYTRSMLSKKALTYYKQFLREEDKNNVMHLENLCGQLAFYLEQKTIEELLQCLPLRGQVKEIITDNYRRSHRLPQLRMSQTCLPPLPLNAQDRNDLDTIPPLENEEEKVLHVLVALEHMAFLIKDIPPPADYVRCLVAIVLSFLDQVISEAKNYSIE